MYGRLEAALLAGQAGPAVLEPNDPRGPETRQPWGAAAGARGQWPLALWQRFPGTLRTVDYARGERR